MKENNNGTDINVGSIENSTEEDIEELKRLLYRNELSQYGKRKLIKYYELQEKDYKRVLKENKELNNRCKNLDEEAQAYLEELMGDNTLTRRTIKQLQEENEELKEKILDNAGIYQLGFKDGEESYIKKVKAKIEEEKLPLVIVGGRRNKRTLEYGIKLGRRQALQELLEGRKS